MAKQHPEDKKARDNLKRQLNKLRVTYSMGGIQTLEDLLKQSGKGIEGYFPNELSHKLSFQEFKEWIHDREIELEAKIFLQHNPPPKDHDDGTTVGPEPTEDRVTHPDQLKDYGYVKSPNEAENLSHFWFQKKAIQEILAGFCLQLVDKTFDTTKPTELHVGHSSTGIETCTTKHGQLLLAGVGTGKTFILGGVLRRLVDIQWHKQVGSISPWPYVYVTKASIVEQTKRVLKNSFNLGTSDVLVINIDQLRSKAGELWIDEQLVVEGGEEHLEYNWRPFIHPALIIWDECQVLKNSGSIQHKIGCAFNTIKEDSTYQIFSSATPFTKVSEAKCFSVATRLKQSFGTIYGAELNLDTWPTFAKAVAAPANPEENSPAAIDRLTDKLDPYIIRVKNVHPQFHAKNKVQMIQFSTAEGAEYYNKTEERFIKKKQKLQAKFEAGDLTAGAYNIHRLVAMQQYRIAAEGNPDRIRYIASEMYNSVAHGYAAVGAFNFKGSIIKLVKMLNETFGVSRDEMSLIWGGGASSVSKKAQNKAELESNPEIMEALKAAGITMEDLQLDDVEAAPLEEEELPEHLRLGSQTLAERQKEIDKFQNGKAKYCFYTFRAGGVGLSLHHTDELTIEKVRKKPSGYAFEEDIPRIPTRPRKCWVAPTWSAIELVQGLGRVPRLTSLSDTEQFLIFFKGTIEEKVARIVGIKLRCLTKVIRQKETWESVILEGKSDEIIQRDYLSEKDNVPDTEEFIGASTPEDDTD